jgi:hypothetical protein
MKRKIVIAGKKKGQGLNDIRIEASLQFENQMQEIAKTKVEALKDRLHEVMRNYFNVSEIKVK